MRVLICKVFDDRNLEKKIGRLVTDEKKRARDRLNVFCLDSVIQQRLEKAGIASEIFPDFELVDSNDEATCEIAYRLSDELHISAENKDELNLSGINFLTMEHYIVKYLHAVKFSNLLTKASHQNWESIILVLTNPHTSWLLDIDTPRIKTLQYGKRVQQVLIVARLLRRRMHQGALILALMRSFFRRLNVKKRSEQHQETAEKQPKVLFIVTAALYARPALSISEACKTNGLIPFFATDDPTLIPSLQASDINYSIKPPFPFSKASYLIKFPRLLRRLRNHIGAFYGARLDEFSAPYLCRETVLAELPELCRQTISVIGYLEKLLKTYSPDIVCVMPQSGFLQQLASAMAKKQGIPTLACSAAWETGTSSSFRRRLHADKLATSGEKMRRMYLDSGLEPDKVVATGIAHFDGLFKRDREQDRQVLLARGLDLDKSIIIFATDDIPMDESEKMLVGVIKAVLKTRDVRLVVKVHPREEKEPFQAIVDRYHDSGILVFKDIDLYALLGTCCLLITKGSTVALEAMIVGKPVIILDLSGSPVAVPYVKEGAALAVYREEDIEEAILKILYDEEDQRRLKEKEGKFVRDWAHEPDGRASERIVALMKDMIKTSQFSLIRRKNERLS